jgi:ribosomal protein S27AE
MVIRDYDPWSGGARRRPGVNIVGGLGSGDGYRTGGGDVEKFCPRCSIQLIWRDDLINWFCVRCGYTPPIEEEESPIPKDASTTTSTNNDDYKPILKNSKNNPDYNNDGPFIIPAGKRRREQQREDLHKGRFGYYDDDMRLLEEKGYTIVDGVETLPTGSNNETLSPEELRRQTERRIRGRW